MRTLFLLLVFVGQVISQDSIYQVTNYALYNKTLQASAQNFETNKDIRYNDNSEIWKSKLNRLSSENPSLEYYKIQYWNGIKWINDSKVIYSNEGNEKIVTVKIWIGNKWINFRRCIMNRMHEVEKELLQQWSDNEWISFWETELKYDNGKLAEKIHKNGCQKLCNYERYNYTYDENDQLSLLLLLLLLLLYYIHNQLQ